MKRFFIIGNPRSGTTLFRLMLNKHSKMGVPPEAGFLVWLYQEYSYINDSISYKEVVESLKNTSKIETWNMDYKALENYLENEKANTYAELMDKVYEFYNKVILNKEVEWYGDKNNYYLNHIDLLHEIYPDAKFIHIIRDGRSVAASYKGVMEKKIDFKYAPKLPTSMKEIADEWTTNIYKIEESFERLSNDLIMTIRYEDLILNTRNVLTDVCLFLSTNYEEQMLNYYKTSKAEGLEPEEYMAWKSKNLQPINANEAEKYKLLSESEIKSFEVNASDLLEKYKYICRQF